MRRLPSPFPVAHAHIARELFLPPRLTAPKSWPHNTLGTVSEPKQAMRLCAYMRAADPLPPWLARAHDARLPLWQFGAHAQRFSANNVPYCSLSHVTRVDVQANMKRTRSVSETPFWSRAVLTAVLRAILEEFTWKRLQCACRAVRCSPAQAAFAALFAAQLQGLLACGCRFRCGSSP
jgi:hypothetical protein